MLLYNRHSLAATSQRQSNKERPWESKIKGRGKLQDYSLSLKLDSLLKTTRQCVVRTHRLNIQQCGAGGHTKPILSSRIEEVHSSGTTLQLFVDWTAELVSWLCCTPIKSHVASLWDQAGQQPAQAMTDRTRACKHSLHALPWPEQPATTGSFEGQARATVSVSNRSGHDWCADLYPPW